jgi:hypothetical protein
MPEYVCRWSARTGSYQTFIVYHAPNGSVVGASPEAGDCAPPLNASP